MSVLGWIAVDFDGTLVEYHGWVGPRHVGKPIKPMVERVQGWLKEGREVRIFTARVYVPSPDKFKADPDGFKKWQERADQARDAREAIEEWCEETFGKRLEVTNEKDYGMVEQWDDRAVRVIPNKGIPCCEGHTQLVL